MQLDPQEMGIRDFYLHMVRLDHAPSDRLGLQPCRRRQLELGALQLFQRYRCQSSHAHVLPCQSSRRKQEGLVAQH